MLVDFVSDDVHLRVPAQYGGKGFELLLSIDGARGVARRANHEELRARRDGGLELFGRNLKVLLDGGLHEHWRSAGEEHHLRVAHPVGSRYDDLVAGIHKRHHSARHALLRTI